MVSRGRPSSSSAHASAERNSGFATRWTRPSSAPGPGYLRRANVAWHRSTSMTRRAERKSLHLAPPITTPPPAEPPSAPTLRTPIAQARRSNECRTAFDVRRTACSDESDRVTNATRTPLAAPPSAPRTAELTRYRRAHPVPPSAPRTVGAKGGKPALRRQSRRQRRSVGPGFDGFYSFASRASRAGREVVAVLGAAREATVRNSGTWRRELLSSRAAGIPSRANAQG
jgi:hypothetical protein